MSAPLLWLIAGVLLCVMEFVLPTAFVELTMGLSAILVAFIAFVVPSFGVQVAIWFGLSLALTLLLRRFLPKRSSSKLIDAHEAQTLTAIPAGQTGRVLYEGNSWQARCEDESLTIAPNQIVYVVGRRGTTLLVLPKSLIYLEPR
ncbi:MAG: NfeD family protein [Synechococcales cyanobacterium C42_A2020_086]|jgi:membrane protein implicated in regulation of membrane protease activity|nr:NfeD family protein [Synechococcales cyanobacterium C42_A2020_086]